MREIQSREVDRVARLEPVDEIAARTRDGEVEPEGCVLAGKVDGAGRDRAGLERRVVVDLDGAAAGNAAVNGQRPVLRFDCSAVSDNQRIDWNVVASRTGSLGNDIRVDQSVPNQ